MVVAAGKRTKRKKTKKGDSRAREELKARTRELLRLEIAFIPNPSFRELDADRVWRNQLMSKTSSDDSRRGETQKSRFRMPAHLERICAEPLLTHKQEQELFCLMNYLKYRANGIRATLNAARPSARKIDQVDDLLARAQRIRDRIVSANTRLVISIIKNFSDERNSFDDLLSDGITCLMKAVEKFDFDRGFRFSTYATSAVRREVFRMIQKTHRDRTRFATGNGDVLHQELIEEDDPDRTEAELTQLESSLARMIDHLDDREQFIVRARYGFIDLGVKPTFTRLGERLGISKERVRQLELRAMNKLRDLVGDYRLEPLIHP